MPRPHPLPALTLPISLQIHQQLISASCERGLVHEDWEIAAIAIQEWLARNSPDSIQLPPTSGYQWKHVFLPHGTLLRTVFEGKNYHCMVENDRILYNGKSVSPNGFANAVGGARRSAWKVIWILFPQRQTWRLAAGLRPKKESMESKRH